MTSFTSRYGDPAAEHSGAHLWAHRRHGATVIAVRGRIDAEWLARRLDEIESALARGADAEALDLYATAPWPQA